MKVYHGTEGTDLSIKPNIVSRYGFRALFCTSIRSLAVSYAYNNYVLNNNGCVYSLNVPMPCLEEDFCLRSSHGSTFRNLVFKLYDLNKKVVRVMNVFDSPDIRTIPQAKSDIIIVFDLRVIQHITLIAKYQK